MKILAKYLHLTDKDLLEKTYDSSVLDSKLRPRQYPSLEGIKTILDQAALKDPKAKAAKPADFVDLRFIEEFDKSGFIDNLYGQKKR